jgi:hypothetical protein
MIRLHLTHIIISSMLLKTWTTIIPTINFLLLRLFNYPNILEVVEY